MKFGEVLLLLALAAFPAMRCVAKDAPEPCTLASPKALARAIGLPEALAHRENDPDDPGACSVWFDRQGGSSINITLEIGPKKQELDKEFQDETGVVKSQMLGDLTTFEQIHGLGDLNRLTNTKDVTISRSDSRGHSAFVKHGDSMELNFAVDATEVRINYGGVRPPRGEAALKRALIDLGKQVAQAIRDHDRQ